MELAQQTSRHDDPLSRDRIAQRLQRPAPPTDADAWHVTHLSADTPAVAAAVLVPLINRQSGIQLLFTHRTSHLANHPGQISFPGGRVEGGDASREDAALREAEEEVGLPRAAVDVLGRLPDYEIPSGFRITPVVGWIAPPFVLALNPREVVEAFEAPLAHFLDPGNYQQRSYDYSGRHRDYLAVPYRGRFIWGATAGMLYSLCRALAAERGEPLL
ncbi:MAG TPA: CoA pyrophosphatase [Burkholderiales bacterium]|jgi:8-oxo-dGTP pyrophosphatase MutT (NUDIX family)|nr:CoA pyrophosphatase [Burkholderiales bacterium]